VNLTLLIASSAALLIGLGFALQQTFSSVMSGLVLLVEGSIRVGDVLKVDNEVVKVLHMGLRTSKVISRDDIVSIIPNSLLVSSKITNWSHEKEATRFRLTITVSYDTDIEQALKLLVESAAESPVSLPDQPPEGRLLDFVDHGLKLELLFWSRENFRIERALSDIRKSILYKFREHAIEIPYPQHVIHMPHTKKGRTS
jgi:small-conductance mechanosensitive channel